MTPFRSSLLILGLLFTLCLATDPNTHHKHHRHHRRHVKSKSSEYTILPLPPNIEFIKEWVTEPLDYNADDCLIMLFIYSLKACDNVVCKRFEKLSEACTGTEYSRAEMLQICCPVTPKLRKNDLEK